MTRDSAIEAISTYFDEGTFQAELANLVSYETESQNPDQAPELKRYLVETMEPRLTAMGFACSFHDNPDPRGGPFLVGERREGERGAHDTPAYARSPCCRRFVHRLDFRTALLPLLRPRDACL